MLRGRSLFTEEQIIEAIQSRGIGFRLTDSVRKELKKDGASAGVLAALEKAYDVLKRRGSAEAAAAAAAAAPASVPLPPALDAPQQTRLLEQVRSNALEYTEKLPNFICVQVTRRAVQIDHDGTWHPQDVIQARLAYNEHKESYQVIAINDQITDRPYDSLGGATSTGEFGTLLLSLFLPETEARFTWVGPAALRQRQVYEYDYQVAQERSRWHLIWQKTRSVVPAYRGRIAVDAESGQVLRLSMEALEVPADFPIRAASSTLDYDYASIAGRSYLLPLQAAVEMKEGRYTTRNEIQFRQYRRFTADTKLVFEDVSAPPSPPPPPPPRP